MSVRLNKLLAQRGVGARRKCDLLIQQGAVRVNGRVVLEPGTQIEPDRDRVTVRNQPLPGAATLRYYVLNKPVGVITTLDDPEGRRTIREFLPPGPRLFPVGRLDADTSGLLILTNDGELAHHLMHPRYGVIKVYRVRLDRAPGPEALRRLQEGVEFEPGVRSAPARVRVLSDEPGDALIEVALHEGRYRQVRRMCEAVGLAVRALHRSVYGPLRLGPVQRGIWRELSEEEVSRLRAACARPRQRGQAGYLSPRSGSDATYRLARRLEKMADEGATRPRPGGRAERPAREERERPVREEQRRPAHGARPRPVRDEQRRPAHGTRPRQARDEQRRPARAGRTRPLREGRSRPAGNAARRSERVTTRGPARTGPSGPARPASRGPARPASRGPGPPALRGPGRSVGRFSGRPAARGPGQNPRRGGRAGATPRPLRRTGRPGTR